MVSAAPSVSALSAPGIGSSTRASTRARRQELTDNLMRRLHGDDQELNDEARAALINEIVVVNTPVAHRIAFRYRGRGCALEDLEQAACLALVRAAHQYDPHEGHHFLSYVVPCITGEIKRYFRDYGWVVRPPRPVQELQPSVEREQLRIDPRSGRMAAEAEIAARLGVTVEEVREAVQVRGCFTPTSLDAPVPGHDDLRSVDRLVDSTSSRAFDAAEARAVLTPALARLTPAENDVLRMWFVEERSQSEIGRHLGISQSHVSRTIRQILARLRDLVDVPEDADKNAA
jgi:RNA polymerase sigma-B factor